MWNEGWGHKKSSAFTCDIAFHIASHGWSSIVSGPRGSWKAADLQVPACNSIHKLHTSFLLIHKSPNPFDHTFQLFEMSQQQEPTDGDAGELTALAIFCATEESVSTSVPATGSDEPSDLTVGDQTEVAAWHNIPSPNLVALMTGCPLSIEEEALARLTYLAFRARTLCDYLPFQDFTLPSGESNSDAKFFPSDLELQHRIETRRVASEVLTAAQPFADCLTKHVSSGASNFTADQKAIVAKATKSLILDAAVMKQQKDFEIWEQMDR